MYAKNITALFLKYINKCVKDDSPSMVTAVSTNRTIVTLCNRFKKYVGYGDLKILIIDINLSKILIYKNIDLH